MEDDVLKKRQDEIINSLLDVSCLECKKHFDVGTIICIDYKICRSCLLSDINNNFDLFMITNTDDVIVYRDNSLRINYRWELINV